MGKNPPSNTGNAGDADSIPGSRRTPGEGNGNPLQYSCLENSMDLPFPGVRPLLGFKRILICLSLGENLPSGTLDGLTSIIIGASCIEYLLEAGHFMTP